MLALDVAGALPVARTITETGKNTISTAQRLIPKETHIVYEKPSTYFKDATYAGTPGTYAGKEVPT